QPEVYAIGANNAVYVKDGAGPWVSLGFYAKAISATVENAIYAIGIDDHLYQSYGVPAFGWANLGSPASGPVRQISAGADAIGNPKVYAIGTDNGVYVNLAIGGFTKLFSYAKQISATMKDTVYAIAGDNAVSKITGGVPTSLGFYAKQISAGLDGTGSP